MAKKRRTEMVAGELIEKPESQLKVMWDTLKKKTRPWPDWWSS